MKKTLFLSLLVLLGSVVAHGDPIEDEKGRVAIKRNLSKKGKKGYQDGFELGKDGKSFYCDCKKSKDYSNGFSLGYFHGKINQRSFNK